MQNWPNTKLGEICSFKYGQMPKASDLADTGYPVFSGYRIVGASSKFHYREPEIIVVARGIGGTGDVKMTPPNCFLTNLSIAVLVESNHADKTFLYYRLGSKRLWELRTGSAQAQITIERLREYEIELPPIATQRRIAGILSAYDKLIENNQRRINILENMARSLYREWFVHFRYPGHESVPLVDSSPGQIPQGWAVRKLGDIAEDMRRNIPKGHLDEPQSYVGLEHIPRRSLALDAWETASELGSNKLAFKKGEILFGKIRPYFHKVSIAPFDGLCSADTIVIRARQPEHYAVVVGCVSSDEFVAHATATSNGSKMPRANWSVLEEYPVVIPTLAVTTQFSAVTEPAIRQMQTLIFQTTNLRRTRDLLLPRLLSGQAFFKNESQHPRAERQM